MIRRWVLPVLVIAAVGLVAGIWVLADTETEVCASSVESRVVICRADFVREVIGLANRSMGEVDISGWTLSDGEGDYTIPDGVRLKPGEIMTIWGFTYNESGSTSGLALAREDSLSLTDEDGVAIDCYAW